MLTFNFLSYAKLMRLDRQIGTLLLLWPTLWAFTLVDNLSVHLIIIFLLGVFFMRSAGCVINDIADVDFDKKVKRTMNRPLATAKTSKKKALILFFILLSFSASLLLLLPPFTWFIAAIAAFLATIYPFMKRITHFPQVILSIAFSMSIVMVFAATMGKFPIKCWLIFIANIFWTIAYDTQYAMVDRDDDVLIGVKSTAIIFGRFDRQIIGILQGLMLISLILVAYLNQLNVFFYVIILFVLLLFIYQQKLIKHYSREQCFKAFLNNNYVGLIIFIGLFVTRFDHVINAF